MKENSLAEVGFPPALSPDLWEWHFPREQAPGWLHCPTWIRSDTPSALGPVSYPRIQTATSTLNPLPASVPLPQLTLQKLYKILGVQEERNPCSHELLPVEMGGCWAPHTHCQGGKGVRAARKVPCTLLICQLYFWLLQAGVPQEKKKKASLKLKQ